MQGNVPGCFRDLCSLLSVFCITLDHLISLLLYLYHILYYIDQYNTRFLVLLFMKVLLGMSGWLTKNSSNAAILRLYHYIQILMNKTAINQNNTHHCILV